jgi:hypothetical protein
MLRPAGNVTCITFEDGRDRWEVETADELMASAEYLVIAISSLSVGCFPTS